MTKQCGHCKIEKSLDSYNRRGRGLQSWCKDCNQERSRAYYELNKEKQIQQIAASRQARKQENRLKMVKFLSERGCVDCGVRDVRVLEFDHRDPATKENDVSRILAGGFSWAKIMLEVEKCDIVCANCHKIRTSIVQKWYKNELLIQEERDSRRRST